MSTIFQMGQGQTGQTRSHADESICLSRRHLSYRHPREGGDPALAMDSRLRGNDGSRQHHRILSRVFPFILSGVEGCKPGVSHKVRTRHPSTSLRVNRKSPRTRWERISLGAGHTMYQMTTDNGTQGYRIPWKGVVAAGLALLLLVALGRV